MAKAEHAVRAVVSGRVQGVGFRDATVTWAGKEGVLGWVRNAEDGSVLVHAEGNRDAVEGLVAFLRKGPGGAAVEGVEVEEVKAEGHEQFAIRGASAGGFEVLEGRGFVLRLEVGRAMRSWAIPKGPSMDPAVKRMALEIEDVDTGSEVWDDGTYEQGGRIPWPEAIERGHAVFVLHGEKLKGGFALQRTRGGEKPQWLLMKRRDDHARRGSDVVGS